MRPQPACKTRCFAHHTIPQTALFAAQGIFALFPAGIVSLQRSAGIHCPKTGKQLQFQWGIAAAQLSGRKQKKKLKEPQTTQKSFSKRLTSLKGNQVVFLKISFKEG
jgi:hypothetical protein